MGVEVRVREYAEEGLGVEGGVEVIRRVLAYPPIAGKRAVRRDRET